MQERVIHVNHIQNLDDPNMNLLTRNNCNKSLNIHNLLPIYDENSIIMNANNKNEENIYAVNVAEEEEPPPPEYTKY